MRVGSEVNRDPRHTVCGDGRGEHMICSLTLYLLFAAAIGGYTFCGLAALLILDECDAIDIDRCLRWAVRRQMTLEGGFSGRTNKLVDGCYSFWVGSLFPML